MAFETVVIEGTRLVILCSMLAIAGGTIYLSVALNQTLRRLKTDLICQHQSLNASFHNKLLSDCKDHYEKLWGQVDSVSVTDLSAGWIETIPLEQKLFNRTISVSSAQSWIRQAPSVLISLGLLGTFAGLTVGLGQISGVLASNVSPSQAMDALSDLLRPMATAFQTSLLGLFLSMVVLIWTQISGSRSCLERCESLLSSWLETIVPLHNGHKLMPSLRNAILLLDTTTKQLPEEFRRSLRAAMRESFDQRLDRLFEAQIQIESHVSRAVDSLLLFSNSLNESGQDFIEAAQAFRDSDFASSLSSSVHSLIETREQLISSTATLNTRLFDVRDSLLSNQSDWSLLAKAAQRELEASRIARQDLNKDVALLREATKVMQEGNQSSIEATKQLREARLEVMRDRKLALETAADIRERLSIDNSTSVGLQTFTASLATALSNWNANVEHLNALSLGFIEAVRNAKLEDEEAIIERSRVAGQVISDLKDKLLKDIGSAISEQESFLAQLTPTTASAQQMAGELVVQLELLRQKIESIPPAAVQSVSGSRLGA